MEEKYILDINVYITDSFPEPKTAQNKIEYISLLNCKTKEVIIFTILENVENSICLINEKELLLKINEFLNNKIIYGYNIDEFDIPYLKNRMKKFDINLIDNFKCFDLFKISKENLKLESYFLPSVLENLKIEIIINKLFVNEYFSIFETLNNINKLYQYFIEQKIIKS